MIHMVGYARVFFPLLLLAACGRPTPPAPTPKPPEKREPESPANAVGLYDAAIRNATERRKRGEAPVAADISKAEAECRAWMECMPKDSEPCWRLARLYAAVEDNEAALEAASRGLERVYGCTRSGIEVRLAGLRMGMIATHPSVSLPLGLHDWLLFPRRRMDWNSYLLDLPRTHATPKRMVSDEIWQRARAGDKADEDSALLATLTRASGGGANGRQLEALARIADAGTDRVEIYEAMAYVRTNHTGKSSVEYADRALQLNPRSIIALACRAARRSSLLREEAVAGTLPVSERVAEVVADLDRLLELRPDLVVLWEPRARAGNLHLQLLRREGKRLGDAPAKTLQAWEQAWKADPQPDQRYGRAVARLACAAADREAGRDPVPELARALAEVREFAAAFPGKKYLELLAADTAFLCALWAPKKYEDQFSVAVEEYRRLDSFAWARDARALAILEWAAVLEGSSRDPKPAHDLLLTVDRNLGELDVALRCLESCSAIADRLRTQDAREAGLFYTKARVMCQTVGQLDRNRLREMQERESDLRRREQGK